MNKYASIDFNKCNPSFCLKHHDKCPVINTCTKNLMEQEGINDPPILVSANMCTACSKCVNECPLKAITISTA